ncbi:site-specific integrase [Intrasporangium mesophilum]
MSKSTKGYGAGSVTQRKDGLWIGRLTHGFTAQGTRRRIVVTGRTETACWDALKNRRREILSGTGALSARTTVAGWSQVWLAQHATRVRPKTYSTQAASVKRWIVPTIGHRRLAEMTPQDVRKVRDAIVSAGRSTSTAVAAHATLRVMLKAAILEGHNVPQRVLLTPPPRRATNDRQAIPLADALQLLAIVSTREDGPRWVAAFLQGLRQGESLGLTWQAVDFDRHLIEVSWQLQSLPYVEPKDHSKGFRVPDGYEVRQLRGSAHLVRPKTVRGYRVVPMVKWLEAALLDYRASWEPNEWGLLWTDHDQRHGGDVVIPALATRDRERWTELQTLAGIEHPAGRPYTVHEIRHTTATLLLEAGVDPRVIEEILGHSIVVDRQTYQHVSTRMALEALDLVAGRLQLGSAS